MPRIDVAALKAAHRLEDLVGQQVVLVPDGAQRLKGCCPFHQERTPSFVLYLDQQTFHCFGAGCQAHGDLFTYLQRIHGWTFRQAAVYLSTLSLHTGTILPSAPATAHSDQEAQRAALQVAMAIYQRDI